MFKDLNRKNLLQDIWTASRPLSLTLALYSTTLGITIAYLQNKLFSNNFAVDITKIILVTLAGLAVQTGTNFINDYFEAGAGYIHHTKNSTKYHFLGEYRSPFDILIFLLGLLCFGVTSLIGLYLVYLTSYRLLIIGLIGIIGGYAYTGKPIVYKKRGLGTPLSFLLMGPLMVLGSYLVFTPDFSWQPILLSLPVSFMIPLLMLSNELRDYKRDKELNVKTLTVRWGYKTGKNLYLSLLLGSYGLTILYVITGLLPITTLLVLITIPLAIKSYQVVARTKSEGVPTTNKLHLIFGLISIVAMVWGQ